MNYNIRGENIQVTEALREYVEKKISRLERYFDNLGHVEVHVTMRVLRGEGTIEVTIPMTGVILRAEETHDDMYAAIDLVVEKLERQMRKYKTKINRKQRHESGAKAMPNMEASSVAVADEEDDVQFDIVRTKRFNLKPMDSEEAIMQMELLGHNFFVFENSESNDVNVVYRRNDGRYGLIEPK
ncbi:ribosome-associated translation inhibitor RaiA [Brevibacillus sp. 7WMA2]|uniref:Ribosome hibernation promoting factor n=1 Tax=Brevibacillus laterosporus LMG 15441 TaxID=1042163 RepID=A0A075RB53_BRELA|nr:MULTISPECIES: ribosome-associated translation inhibitor RaiA [Brevibacillus]AIG28626.1 SigL modulation protein YvyD [Brevibacillus laterosporus LMG 15441]AUM66961.1 ribosome-associated translation inhibitor RaiA [Brevibacillus laterosporus]AYK05819.1 ribosome-associated translation inhibitor RaiA [Brevibacillus laterosporus]ERM17123.1 sigma-54 modulation protein [Brevibacillus laterosporus PE36]MBA4531885.1 ribosome-associated translation inhibitor RaiA [Brevibacillus halotolerans]